MSDLPRTKLAATAESILRANDRGGYNVPSPRLYPHQWNWDSAFCAIGWSHIDPARAVTELDMLARGLWQRGLIPHILFNPNATNYEPSPAVWETEGRPGAPEAVRTSSITQPPVAATALRIICERAPDHPAVLASARRLVPAFARWHAWFEAERMVGGSGCVSIVHPWESGMDNSPRWDEALARVTPIERTYKRVDNTVVDPSQRPTHAQYDRYFALVKHWSKVDFGPPDPKRDPFVVEDISMTAILCAAEADLIALAERFGERAIAQAAQKRRDRIAADLERRFDTEAGRWWDRDLVSGQDVRKDTIATILPIVTGTVAGPIVDRIARELEQGKYATAWPVPSTPPGDPAFESRRYWRGPSWPNTNWLFIRALDGYGKRQLADKLAERTLALVAKTGFFEYFEPQTGEGLGGDQFSWTAAVVLDLLRR